MLDEPYLAAALACLPFIDATETSWCHTMATDGYHIFWDQRFTSTMSVERAEIRHRPRALFTASVATSTVAERETRGDGMSRSTTLPTPCS
jgi:hypothetical protein